MSKQQKLPSAQRQKLPTMRSTMQAIRCINTIDLEEWLEVRATKDASRSIPKVPKIISITKEGSDRWRVVFAEPVGNNTLGGKDLVWYFYHGDNDDEMSIYVRALEFVRFN